MAAQKQLEQIGIPELDLRYSAPMAGPYDLSGTMQDLMYDTLALASPYFLPYTIAAYASYYKQESLAVLLVDSIAEPLMSWFSGSYSGGELNAKLPSSSIDMFVADARELKEAFVFDSLLQNNSINKTVK